MRGKEAVLGWLSEPQQRSAEDRIDIVKSRIDGSRIWTERIDHHLIDGQWHDIPVMRIIELNAD